jgi:hypothetical protein
MGNLEERIPCPDDLCTGTLNEKGVCNYCGMTRDGYRAQAEVAEREEVQAEAGDSERIPCIDDNCTGTVNEQGLCNYCRKPHPDYAKR